LLEFFPRIIYLEILIIKFKITSDTIFPNIVLQVRSSNNSLLTILIFKFANELIKTSDTIWYSTLLDVKRSVVKKIGSIIFNIKLQSKLSGKRMRIKIWIRVRNLPSSSNASSQITRRFKKKINKGLTKKRTPFRLCPAVTRFLFTIGTSSKKCAELMDTEERALTRLFAKDVIPYPSDPRGHHPPRVKAATTGFGGRYINLAGTLFNLQPLIGCIAWATTRERGGMERVVAAVS